MPEFCLRPATLLKNGIWQNCFPVNFAKFLREAFFYRKPSGRYQKLEKIIVLKVFAKSGGKQVPEFSFRKVPDIQPTALPNPFLVLSCEFCVCEQFQSSYFPEHLWKTASDIGFLFFKKKILTGAIYETIYQIPNTSSPYK